VVAEFEAAQTTSKYSANSATYTIAPVPPDLLFETSVHSPFHCYGAVNFKSAQNW